MMSDRKKEWLYKGLDSNHDRKNMTQNSGSHTNKYLQSHWKAKYLGPKIFVEIHYSVPS